MVASTRPNRVAQLIPVLPVFADVGIDRVRVLDTDVGRRHHAIDQDLDQLELAWNAATGELNELEGLLRLEWTGGTGVDHARAAVEKRVAALRERIDDLVWGTRALADARTGVLTGTSLTSLEGAARDQEHRVDRALLDEYGIRILDENAVAEHRLGRIFQLADLEDAGTATPEEIAERVELERVVRELAGEA